MLVLFQFQQPISICTSHSGTASLRLRCTVGAFTTRQAAFPTENNNNNHIHSHHNTTTTTTTTL